MGAFLRVQVPLRVGHSEQSEAQRREGGGQQSRWWRNSNRLLKRTLNATTQRDVLGTLMRGLLAGHRRYAHITTLRGDAVAAQALGLNKIVSEAAQAGPGEHERA